MMRTRAERKSTSSSLATHADSDDEPDANTSTASSRRMIFGNLDFYPGPLSASVKLGITKYDTELINACSDPRDFVLYSYRHSTMDSHGPNVTLAIFGWANKGPSRYLSYARPDIRDGAPRLMNLMYLLGSEYFSANIVQPVFFGFYEPHSFMTFAPSSIHYFPPGQPGSYVSTMQEIGQYFKALDRIDVLPIQPGAHTIFLLTLLFDFAAFCAQSFRRLIGTSISSPEQVADTRCSSEQA